MAGIPNIDIDPPKYGPPNMAAQLFGMISSLPDAYQQGVKQKFERGQMARTEKLQEPINLENGQLDYSSLVQKYLQAKGTEAIPDVLPNAWKTQALQNDQPTPSPYSPSNPNMTPDAHTGRAGRVGENDQPQGPAGENPTHQNIRQLAINAGIDPQSDAFRQAFAGTDIDREFSPGKQGDLQRTGVNKRIDMLRQGDAGPPQMGTTAALGTAGPGAPAPGQQGTMYMPGPGMQGGTPPALVAQAGQAAPGGAAGMVPPGVDPRAYAQRLKQAAEGTRDKARREGIVGIPSKALEDKAAAFDKTADDILKEIGEAGRPTGTQKEVRDPAVQQREIDKLRSEDFQKNKVAIFKAGQQAEESIPQIELSRRIVNSPGFNSGLGHQFFDSVQSLSQQLFGGTELKNPGELYDKFRSGEVLNQIRSLGASGVGAVRVPEMKAVDKLIADRDVQAPGIRAVTEVESRLQKRVREVYYKAQEYLQTHRELDDGFSKEISAWKNKQENHLFSEAELTKPELLSMPVFSNPGEMRASKLPPGSAFRTPSGEVGHVP